MISAVFHRSVQRESGNVVLLWTSPSSRLPDDVGRFHPSNPLFLPTRYKPSFLAHIKTYAFRYPNIPKDHTVNVPYYGCSPFSRRGVDRFGPAKVRDASARHRISHLSPPFYYRATTRNGCFTVEARLSSGLAFNSSLFLRLVRVLRPVNRHNVYDPSAGSPTETLLRLLLPLKDQVRTSFSLAVGRPHNETTVTRRSGKSPASPSEVLTKSFNR